MTDNEKRSAAEALKAARASIQKWWVKGSLVETRRIPQGEVAKAKADGDEVITITGDWEDQYYVIRGTCAIGAVAYAERLVTYQGYFQYPPSDHPLVILLNDALPKDVHVRLGYTKRDWEECEDNQSRVIAFNDSPNTTKRMVLALFARAIKLAEDPEYRG